MHWMEQIIENRNATAGLSEELVATAKEAATAATEATEAATTAAANLSKIISEGEALSNHKERLDGLDEKVSQLEADTETLDAAVVKAITLGDVTKQHAPDEDGVANIPKAEADGNGFGVVRLATGWDDTGAVAVMSAASILEKINESAPDLSDYAKTSALDDYAKKSDLTDYAAPLASPALTGTATLNGVSIATTADIPDTSNFVDLTSNQTITGKKTFSAYGFTVDTPDGDEIMLRSYKDTYLSIYAASGIITLSASAASGIIRLSAFKATYNSSELATVDDIPDVSGFATKDDISSLQEDIAELQDTVADLQDRIAALESK